MIGFYTPALDPRKHVSHEHRYYQGKIRHKPLADLLFVLLVSQYKGQNRAYQDTHVEDNSRGTGFTPNDQYRIVYADWTLVPRMKLGLHRQRRAANTYASHRMLRYELPPC